MKLKEAQILGILAIIAVGIIVVCLWGGGQPSDGAADGMAGDDMWATDGEGVTSDEPDDMEDLYRLLEEEEDDLAADDSTNPFGVDVTVDVDGPPSGVRPVDEAWPLPGRERQRTVVPTSPPVAPPRLLDPPPALVHTVQKGDTLYDISAKYYKSSKHWKKILNANKAVISEPKDLRPKMKLTIPKLKDSDLVSGVPGRSQDRAVLSTGTGTLASGKRYYDVQKGDTLYGIAMKHYKDAGKWKAIQKANADLISDPKKLKAGMRLVLP